MKTERWERLWRSFHRALALSPEERAAWIDAEVGSVPGLAEELRSLIHAHEQQYSVLDAPLLGTAPPAAGARVGPWRLLHELGRGGVGVVWLAERADGAYHRQAAVKLLAPVWSGAASIRRFEREREILARLSHPHIALMLDGGTTGEGQPYLVMEYVQGETLDVYCREHGLTLEARLALFREVCDAVDYAHRQLVVHRDLKPGNILVTEECKAKLLDFGIAHLQQSMADRSVTAPAERRLTPDYASPEQLRGESAGTSADVFSLGVILYELLAGCRPWDLGGLTAQRAYTVMERSRPAAPSQANHSGPVKGTDLRGDLDRIVLKAIELEPALRYSGARELAQDIERYRRGLPVLARPPTWTYHLSRFVRRHPVAVSASGAALGLLCSLTLALWFKSAHLQQTLEQAQQQTQRAEALGEFLTELFRQADPEYHGVEAPTVAGILSRGLERVRSAFDAQPDVKAALLTTLGRIHVHLGDYDTGEALLNEALALHGTRGGIMPSGGVDTVIELARLHQLLQHHSEAEALARRALAAPATGGDADAVFSARLALAAALQSQGRLAEAEAELRDALATGVETGEGWLRLGALAWGKAEFDTAEAHYRRALAAYREAHGAESPQAARALNAVAATLYRQGDYTAAETLYREVLALRERIYGIEHPRTVETQVHLGALLYDMGRYDAAIDQDTRALALQRKIFGPGEPALANLLNNLAVALMARQRFEEAEARLTEALRITRAAHGERHAKVAGNLGNLGLMQLELGDVRQAAVTLEQALDIQLELYPEPHPATAYTLNHLGRAALEAGDLAAARSRLAQALAIRSALHDPDHPQLADTLLWLGRVALAEQRPKDAAGHLEKARRIRKRALGDRDWRTAESGAFLGLALCGSGNPERGRPLLDAGIARMIAVRGEDDPRVRTLAAARGCWGR